MDRFSLIAWKKTESIFVLVVIVGLVLVSWLQLKTGQAKTRDAQRKSDVELVGRALNNYLAQTQTLPKASVDGQIMACGFERAEACVWGQDEITDVDGVVYLKKLPQDPQSERGRKYIYEVSPDGLKYYVYIGLELKSDPAFKANLTTSCGNSVQCNWYVKN